MPIDWNLLSPMQVQRGVMDGFRQGQAIGDAAREAQDRRELRKALSVIATDPENQNALATVFERDPRLGAALMDRADEKALGRDAAAMMAPGGQPNALLGLAGHAKPAAPAMNALAAPVAAQEAPQAQAQPAAPEADLSGLGEPQTAADAAFLRMVRRDPIKALKIRSALRDNFVDQLQAEGEVYTLGIGELSRATDQASWNAALQAVAPRAQAAGMDIFSIVPTAYPGPDGVAELMRRAQPVKEQLDRILREANIEADNARADRNTDSMIEAREAGVAERERSNRAREGNQRRGQDISSRDRRRRSRREAIRTVRTPEEAMRLPSGTKFRTPDGTVKVRP